MIPENIQFTYITGSFFGILRVRGFFELEIQRHGGYMYLQLELWGCRDLLEGTDKSVKAQMNWLHCWLLWKARYMTSINPSRICLHSLTEKSIKNLGCTLGSRGPKSWWISCQKIICDECWPAMFVCYVPVIIIYFIKKFQVGGLANNGSFVYIFLSDSSTNICLLHYINQKVCFLKMSSVWSIEQILKLMHTRHWNETMLYTDKHIWWKNC